MLVRAVNSLSLQSNNMVLDSAVRYWRDPSRLEGVVAEGKPHVITSNLEHDSVMLCVKRLEEEDHIGEPTQ